MKNTSEPNSLKWEERFDEYFYDADHSLTPRQVAHIKKNLVAQLLSQQKEEFKKMCEGMKLELVDEGLTWEDTKADSNTVRLGYNQALTEIINKLDENQKAK